MTSPGCLARVRQVHVLTMGCAPKMASPTLVSVLIHTLEKTVIGKVRTDIKITYI